ncbi:terminase TerL endonuclease subunit [Pseudomonas aeruginosa]
MGKNDDIKDESNWIKANPIVATYEEGLEGIRSDLKVALDRPEKMRAFNKNMNIWVDKRTRIHGYIKMAKMRVDTVDFSGATLWIGGDLSMTTDLTSVG